MTTDRDAIVNAAYALFAQKGYEKTSVDDIATSAGLSRSTFFRSYGTKEAVVFPDHDRLLAQVEARLRATHNDPGLTAVTDAVKVVLTHYVAEGDRARQRYRLTSTVASLRERELGSTARYQNLFRTYLSRWGDGSETAELRAELMAAAVVAAHNRVLRRWLRGQSDAPHHDVERALRQVHEVFTSSESTPTVAVLVVPAETEWSQVEAAVLRAVEHPQTRSV